MVDYSSSNVTGELCWIVVRGSCVGSKSEYPHEEAQMVQADVGNPFFVARKHVLR